MRGGQEREDRRGEEQSPKAGRLHQELAERRPHGAGDEPRDPEDPERLAAPVGRHQVDRDREVRDEEDGEGHALERPQQREEPQRVGRGREQDGRRRR